MTTKNLETILARTLLALQGYRRGDHGDWHDPAHAAAVRASLDATRALAAWRQTPKVDKRR